MNSDDIENNVYQLQVQVTSKNQQDLKYVQIRKQKVQTAIWKYEVVQMIDIS